MFEEAHSRPADGDAESLARKKEAPGARPGCAKPVPKTLRPGLY